MPKDRSTGGKKARTRSKGSVNNRPRNPDRPSFGFAQRYQAFFESTHDAIVAISPGGEILDANPQFLTLVGSAYNTVVSQSISDFFEEDACAQIMIRMRSVFENKQGRTPIECMLRHRSGKHQIVEMTVSLLTEQYGFEHSLLAAMRDVTHRKEMEKRLVERAEELQRVFDTVSTMLIVIDDKRKIQRVNRFALETLRKELHEVVGKRIGDVLSCNHRLEAKRGCGIGSQCLKCKIRENMIRCLKLQEAVLNVEESIVSDSPKGSLSHYRMNVSPLKTNGTPWCLLSMEDITDKKKADMETVRLHNSIARANLELKKTLEDLTRSQSQLIESQKLEQIGLLASGLAHNLKTPLCGIKGYAQLLKMDHAEMEELDLILTEADAMESIINNLMLKSRKEHENKDEPVNLNDLIKVEMNFLNANMFFKYQVDLQLDLDGSLPPVNGVYSHFSQAFMNIVQNSLDAMYGTTEKKLTVRTRHDDRSVNIDIIDTGCGIPESVREKVFNLFFTTKPTVMERKGDEPFGTGLGLSSAHYFIRQYGGDIEISSEVGHGTTATIRIPYAQKKMKEPSRTRVLVVDDSNTVLDVVVKICQDMGMEVFSATNGKKGLNLYSKWKPQIVISDLCMPELSGTEMMSQIRKNNPSQKVIYISGYFENPEYQEWLKHECTDDSVCVMIKKPFPLDQFREILKRMGNS